MSAWDSYGSAPAPRGWDNHGPAGFGAYNSGRRGQGLGWAQQQGYGTVGGSNYIPQRITLTSVEDSDFTGPIHAGDYGPLPHQFPHEELSDRLTLFVSNIATALDDFWVERILNCAGPMLSLKRVKDADGKPKAIGFAEYGDYDTVLRCLEVINGCVLRGEDGVEKALSVKADNRTRPRLDTYEKQRLKTSRDGELLTFSRNNLSHVLSEMSEPTSVLFATGGQSTNRRRPQTISHLQDLQPDDLPAESRGMITSEIAFFRDRAFKPDPQREAERMRRQKAALEQARQQAQQNRPPPVQPQPSSRFDVRPGSGSPAGFVRERPRSESAAPAPNGAAASSPAPMDVDEPRDGLSDEERERRRLEEKRRQAEQEFRERELKWEQHERSRDHALSREADRDRRDAADEERAKRIDRERFAKWDDDYEVERGREIFYYDRPRWRTSRRVQRQKELDADQADAELEAKQLEEQSASADAFLNQQADALAARTPANPGTGASLDDTTHIKLSLVVPSTAAKKEDAVLPKLVRPATAFVGAEDEDEDQLKKKKLRPIIPLTYDDIDPEAGMTEAEKLERRKAKVKELVDSIPAAKEDLWQFPVAWDYLTDNIIDDKLVAFVNKKTVEALGMQEDEIAKAVVEHVRAKKSAAELVDELEPVLENDTEAFVLKCWRFIIFEALASRDGIQTYS